MQCSMAWALHRTEKEKPAAGKTDYWRDFWRSGWDSNPRNLAVQLISSQSRYDHFDTAPYLSQHQHLGKRGELMGRTSKNIKLRIPEKPHKIKGFRSESYRVATTISSLVRTWYFRVCCGRWRQFWKRRKPLCCNGFWTRRPVLTSSISEKARVQIEMESAPKRSIFCALARKYARRKPLSGMALRTAPRIKCKKNRLKTDYTKHPFGPKHRKESSL